MHGQPLLWSIPLAKEACWRDYTGSDALPGTNSAVRPIRDYQLMMKSKMLNNIHRPWSTSKSIFPPGLKAIILVLWPVLAFGQFAVVQAELERLAAEQGFVIIGASLLGEGKGRIIEAEPRTRIRKLLENYDYVIVQDDAANIERIIILGEKGHSPSTLDGLSGGGDDKIKVESVPSDRGPLIRVVIEGTSGERIAQEMLVDRRTDYVVLPAALMPHLMMKEDDYPVHEITTGQGNFRARIGPLPPLWLGESPVLDLQGAFVDDPSLEAHGLIGKSLLSRYQLSFEKNDDGLTLTRKDEDSDDSTEEREGMEGSEENKYNKDNEENEDNY